MKKQVKIILLIAVVLPIVLIGYFWRDILSRASLIDSLTDRFLLYILIVLAILPFASLALLATNLKKIWLKVFVIAVCLVIILLTLFNTPYFLNTGIAIEPGGLTENIFADNKYNYRIKYPTNFSLKLYSEFERDVFYNNWYDKVVDRHVHFDVPGFRGFDAYVSKGQLNQAYNYKVMDTSVSSGLYRYSHDYQLPDGYILELVRYFVEDEKYADQIQLFKDLGKNNVFILNAPEIKETSQLVFISELTKAQFNLATSTLIVTRGDVDANKTILGGSILAYRNSETEWSLIKNKDYYLPKDNFINIGIDQLKDREAFNKIFNINELPEGFKLADLKKALPLSDDPVYITTDNESIHLMLKLEAGKEENYLYSVANGMINLIGYFNNNQ